MKRISVLLIFAIACMTLSSCGILSTFVKDLETAPPEIAYQKESMEAAEGHNRYADTVEMSIETEAEDAEADEPDCEDAVLELYRLGINRQNCLMFDSLKALLSSDFKTFEKELYLDDGALDAWEGIVISDYTVIREDMTSQWVGELAVDLTVTGSTLERLPDGEYRVRISEGMNIDYFFESKSSPREEPKLTDRESRLLTYCQSYGGGLLTEEKTENNFGYLHCLLDMYLRFCWDLETEPTPEDFSRFCFESFGIKRADSYFKPEEITDHGGHGLGTVLCGIRSISGDGDSSIVTVDFYADPMKTVTAYTVTFDVTETGNFYRINSCERTYDSGLRAYGWSV